LGYYKLSGEIKLALYHARRLVDLDPWREESQAMLIELLARDGQRSAALKQYETCRRLLEEELGVEPREETERLYRQVQAGKLSESPTFRTPKNLPAEITSFVGRQDELERLSDYLQRLDCRLITLIGPGGVGKTCLAVQAAGQAAFTYTSGAFWVGLSGVDDPQSLPLAIAESLGQTFSNDKNPRTQLIDFLRQKEILLVLDNFEHLLDGTDLIAEILREAGKITILVTSREPLRLLAEWLLPIEGLAVSSPDDRPVTVEPDAARLYKIRAQRVLPSYELTPESLPRVIELCQLLGGLPLGIELAAATAHIFSPDQIYEKISQNLDFLSSQLRDVPERHRSLRAVFEHSWNLLATEEQETLSRLSVFRSGFTVEAARIIAGASQEMLTTLAEKSLLQYPTHERYGMHEIVRQFAAEKHKILEGDSQNTRALHSQYYLHWIWNNERLLRTADRHTLKTTVVEMDNIRHAWSWACANQRLDLLDLGTEALMQFYDARSRYLEGESAIREALERLTQRGERPAGSGPEEMRVYGRLVGYSGWMSQRQGAFDQSRRLIEESLQIMRGLGDDALVRTWERRLGYVAYMQSDYEAAGRFTESALGSARQAGDVLDIQDCLNNLGLVANQRGEHEQARGLYQEWLGFTESQNDLGRTHALINLGLAHYYQGEYAIARTHFQEAARLSEQLENRFTLGLALSNLGIVEKAVGNLEQALAHFRKTLEIQTEIGNRLGIAANLSNLGSTLGATGDHKNAQVYQLQALEIL
jgi:predicted ATPase/Tfp pilus assembly protein PilF